jgi:hypothetical protein
MSRGRSILGVVVLLAVLAIGLVPAVAGQENRSDTDQEHTELDEDPIAVDETLTITSWSYDETSKELTIQFNATRPTTVTITEAASAGDGQTGELAITRERVLPGNATVTLAVSPGPAGEAAVVVTTDDRVDSTVVDDARFEAQTDTLVDDRSQLVRTVWLEMDLGGRPEPALDALVDAGEPAVLVDGDRDDSQVGNLVESRENRGIGEEGDFVDDCDGMAFGVTQSIEEVRDAGSLALACRPDTHVSTQLVEDIPRGRLGHGVDVPPLQIEHRAGQLADDVPGEGRLTGSTGPEQTDWIDGQAIRQWLQGSLECVERAFASVQRFGDVLGIECVGVSEYRRHAHPLTAGGNGRLPSTVKVKYSVLEH